MLPLSLKWQSDKKNNLIFLAITFSGKFCDKGKFNFIINTGTAAGIKFRLK